MEKLSIEKFKPTVAELKALVEESKQIGAVSLTDKDQLQLVKESRVRLRDVRVLIERTGKALRADALAFQKAVITKEKELVAIVDPEETRLKDIEDKAAQLEEIEKRKATLPRRQEVLKEAGLELSEDEILSMDDNAFIEFKNTKIAEKQELERQRLAEESRKIEAEKAELARQRELKEAEERGKKEAEAKAKQAKQIAEAKAIRDKQEAEARALREKEEADRKEAEQKERLEKETKYRAFRAKYGWTEETKADFKEERQGDEVVLWKKVGTFKTK